MGLTGDKFGMLMSAQQLSKTPLTNSTICSTMWMIWVMVNMTESQCAFPLTPEHINQHMDDLYSMFNLEPPKIDNPFE